MARILIVGGGRRGRVLAASLADDGYAVRCTTRDPARGGEIAAAGAEMYVGDPDRIGSLMAALSQVTIACWMLGSATGEAEAVAALHSTRLRFFLEKTVDTMVRGVVYEAAGTVPAAALAGGVQEVRDAHDTWTIPVATITADPADHAAWLTAARAAVDGLLVP